jgi:phosphatidylethanolamine/phosphatidyl-N-methylethanolamine N-methyltransferase
MKPDSAIIRKRYNRLARFYDVLEAPMEGMVFKPWRQKIWGKVSGNHVLEVGVGTGKNFDYYPKDSRMTAIDFSPAMLAVATAAKARKNVQVELACEDIQALCYADNSFDTVIATFVFCSVPQAGKGLMELYRVCRPGGQVLLLEHVLSRHRALAAVMHWLNPLVLKLIGANINRNTVKTVQSCPFSAVRVDEASSDIIKIIEAVK